MLLFQLTGWRIRCLELNLMFDWKTHLTDNLCKLFLPLNQMMDCVHFGHSITTVERLKDLMYVVRRLYGLRILIDNFKLLFLGERLQVLCCEYVIKTRRQNVDLAFSQTSLYLSIQNNTFLSLKSIPCCNTPFDF